MTKVLSGPNWIPFCGLTHNNFCWLRNGFCLVILGWVLRVILGSKWKWLNGTNSAQNVNNDVRTELRKRPLVHTGFEKMFISFELKVLPKKRYSIKCKALYLSFGGNFVDAHLLAGNQNILASAQQWAKLFNGMGIWVFGLMPFYYFVRIDRFCRLRYKQALVFVQ